MSNREKVNPVEKTTVAAEPTAAEPAKEKTTIVGKILHVRDKIKASKVGRICIKGLKAVGVGGIAYVSYKAGAKSVKPTTVYIREGVTEEEPEEPTETIDQETGEVIEE